MLPAAVMARLANSALPIWLWEILSSLAVAARILTVFGVAIVLGVLGTHGSLRLLPARFSYSFSCQYACGGPFQV